MRRSLPPPLWAISTSRTTNAASASANTVRRQPAAVRRYADASLRVSELTDTRAKSGSRPLHRVMARGYGHLMRRSAALIALAAGLAWPAAAHAGTVSGAGSSLNYAGDPVNENVSVTPVLNGLEFSSESLMAASAPCASDGDKSAFCPLE